ncbi:hypothetical protein H0E87_026335 [Populus deltoides]|uniref:Uncharacterized protein n=1 Tax=Populus deltoides TaxID=3696 RepID=A0A8T2X3W9_POPDE|nr:hypothetical protein H0E87_026335 [Populus deltoides]
MLELFSLAFLFGGGTDVGEALRGMICFQIHSQAISSMEQRTPCFANKLDGSLPSELGNCSSLVEPRLQNNLLEGNLPPESCNVENLEVLFLSNNARDWEKGRLSNLKILALYSNNVTDLHRIDQTANRLYGLIPPCVCNGTNPRVLMLGEFRFNGSFPIGICLFLRRVIRGDNLLSGSMPTDLERNSGISYLEVRGNLLEVPAVFGLWSNLSMIGFSGNKLSSSVTPELGELANLQVLRLSSNSLTGSILSDMSHCRKLIKMDLIKNQF